MQRKVGQDIILKRSGQTRSISAGIPLQKKNIPVSDGIKKLPPTIKKNTITNNTHQKSEKKEAPYHASYPPSFIKKNHQPPQKMKAGILWWLVAGSVIVLGSIVASVFLTTHISITLQEKTYSINDTITLQLEPSEQQLGFKFAKVTDRQTVAVPPDQVTGMDTTGTKALGTIRLFSKSNTVSIPKGSIVTSTSGQNFVTTTSVTIPAGTSEKPGSVDVGIIAVSAGESGNVGLDDFTVSKKPEIIARAITEITGGKTIGKPIITESAMVSTRTTLETIMERNQPISFLVNQTPDNYIIPRSLVYVSDPVYTTINTEKETSVIAERTITGYMISKESLKEFIHERYVAPTEQSFMDIFDITNLNFVFVESSIVTDTTVPVKISGSFRARAQLDGISAKQSIARKKKSEATTILRNFPGVAGVTMKIWPPWISRITDSASKISFSVDYLPSP